MKVTSNVVPPKSAFEPVELTILIENEVDLSWLWACVNCTLERAQVAARGYPQMGRHLPAACCRVQDQLFDYVDDIAKAKGLKED